MTEQNLFKPIDTIQLYNDNIGKVTLYDASHSNESEEQRIHTVTTLASLAYGNESAKNPEALYERMQSIKHESLWEFIRDGVDTCDSIACSMRNYFDTMEEYELGYYKEHKQNIACFRIKVPIFVARQFMRHRSFSYLEMSRRYTKDAKVPFEFWFPQDFNEQFNHVNDFAESHRQDFKSIMHRIATKYHTQVASRFLPQITYTEYYIMGEVEGLKNFFKLRLKEDAQAEIREVAEAMLQLLKTHQYTLYYKMKHDDA